MLLQELLKVVQDDPHFFRLLSMVWMDAKDFRLGDYQKLCLGTRARCLNLAELNGRSSPRAFAILKASRWWHPYQEKLRQAELDGIRWVSVLDEEYPPGLLDLDSAAGVAPLGFWVQGRIPRERCVSVVGSRHPVSGVVLWMKSELEPWAATPWTLVSGGARGVDFWAHEICLNRKSSTVVVLPSGILNPYPSEWVKLRRQVLDSGGCFLSEYDCTHPLRKYHFHARNRLIAAFSPVTLILQAARKSGTWMTANWSVTLSKTLGVLPGPGWDPRFSASHDLIRGGGVIVTDRSDVEALVTSSSNSF